jgi:hypothetical protein
MTQWNGTAFNSGETYFTWNSGPGVAAGSVVRLSAFASGAPLASAGAISRVSVTGNTGGGLGQTAETLYLYEGASATSPTRFITVLTSGDLTATSGSLQGTGLAVSSNALQLGYLLASQAARDAKAAGLDIIIWTLERSGILADGNNGFYHQTFDSAIKREGGLYCVIDVLAQDVGILGVFSDWAAPVTFYANCMGLK